jgi:hypothetical protein
LVFLEGGSDAFDEYNINNIFLKCLYDYLELPYKVYENLYSGNVDVAEVFKEILEIDGKVTISAYTTGTRDSDLAYFYKVAEKIMEDRQDTNIVYLIEQFDNDFLDGFAYLIKAEHIAQRDFNKIFKGFKMRMAKSIAQDKTNCENVLLHLNIDFE